MFDSLGKLKINKFGIHFKFQGLIETIQRCKAEGKAWEGIVVNNRKGQDPISVEMKIMPVFDAEGNK